MFDVERRARRDRYRRNRAVSILAFIFTTACVLIGSPTIYIWAIVHVALYAGWAFDMHKEIELLEEKPEVPR